MMNLLMKLYTNTHIQIYESELLLLNVGIQYMNMTNLMVFYLEVDQQF